MVTGCLFLVMLAFLLSICTFLTWQNCCKGRYQWKKTLQPDTAIAELRFSKIRVTIVRQLSKTGWSHLLPLWDDPAPGPDADVWLPPGRLGITRPGWGPPTSRTDHSASPPSSYPGPDISHLPQFYWALGREVSFDWPPPHPAPPRLAPSRPRPEVTLAGCGNWRPIKLVRKERHEKEQGWLYLMLTKEGRTDLEPGRWQQRRHSGEHYCTTALWANTAMQVRNMGIGCPWVFCCTLIT